MPTEGSWEAGGIKNSLKIPREQGSYPQVSISTSWSSLYISHMSNEKTLGWLFLIGDDKLPSYMGIMISQYKDPYKPTSIMECHKGFERCSHVLPSPSESQKTPPSEP